MYTIEWRLFETALFVIYFIAATWLLFTKGAPTMSAESNWRKAERMAARANEMDRKDGYVWTAEDWRYWTQRFYNELEGGEFNDEA